MKIEQIYTGCLAQGAYYIESNGEVAIIDPLREVKPYIDRAKLDNAKIKYIFETHFHADFVSGHVTLSKETEAPIVFGPNAETNFDAVIAEDGQIFKLGNITITVLHTPGHTMESSVYLLKDEKEKDHAIFSGDTLFLGDVGRPDLAQKTGSITEEDLAGFLFDSLRNKIMPLADDVIVYPAHGAGSSCGKNLSKETVDTLGNQKQTNYALRADMTKEEFIKEVTDGLLPPPQYFPLNVKMNKEGYDDFQDVLKRSAQALQPEAFETAANETEAVVLDVRNQDDFVKGHIPRSIFIGLDGSFAPWAASVIKDIKSQIILVVDPSRAEEAITRLSRVGIDNTLGYLKGGMNNWIKQGYKTDTVRSISPLEFEKEIDTDSNVVDVRAKSEYENGHLLNSQLLPLGNFLKNYENYNADKKNYLHCQGGYRSMIVCSLLKRKNINNIVDIQGGFAAISKETSLKIQNELIEN